MRNQTLPGLRRLRRALQHAVVLVALVGLGANFAPPAELSATTPQTAVSIQAAVETLATDQTAAPGVPVLSPDGVFVPDTVPRDRPVPVLLALHGMGGSGQRILERLTDCATRYGWIVVAPTFAYRDYMDPQQVRLDDQQNLPRVRAMLESLPEEIDGVHISRTVYVYGFSRGAQAAHRFAFFYPELVDAVATLSAGSYTLPRATTAVAGGGEQPLAFPFGLSDLDRYAGHAFRPADLHAKPFWIGVGATDVAADQVPRSWDPYVGKTRVERAERFAEALRGAGAEVSLNLFSGTGHEETAAMRDRACEFLAAHPVSSQP